MLPNGFKPLLAEKADLDNVTFPVIASPKIDGIRAMTGVLNGAICSRTFKAIPNRHTQDIMAYVPPFLDGELLTYTDGVRDPFETVQSKVMRRDGEPDVRFHVFDYFGRMLPYTARLDAVKMHFAQERARAPNVVELVPHQRVDTVRQLMEFEQACVDEEGWEGVMIRAPHGIYKFGRSTAREGILLKVKRFEDAEAIITGTVERMHNTNEATKNALGRTQRSSAKAGKVGLDTLGAIQARWNDIDFEIGTGLDDAQRARLWADRDSLIGQSVTFKYQGVGSKGAPRFPVYVGLRHDLT